MKKFTVLYGDGEELTFNSCQDLDLIKEISEMYAARIGYAGSIYGPEGRFLGGVNVYRCGNCKHFEFCCKESERYDTVMELCENWEGRK